MKTVVEKIPDYGLAFRAIPGTILGKVTIELEEDNEISGYKKGDKIKLPKEFLIYRETGEIVFPEEVEKSIKKIREQQ